MDMASKSIELRRPRVESAEFLALVEASRLEGFWMLARLLDGWRDGTGRFRRRGEMLLAAFHDDALAGVCGLSVDPYVEARREGRVRHLYVAEAHRGLGIGRLLVRAVIGKAKLHFPVLNVRATGKAFGFYERLGFRPVEGEEFMTHRMAFRRRQPVAKRAKVKAA